MSWSAGEAAATRLAGEEGVGSVDDEPARVVEGEPAGVAGGEPAGVVEGAWAGSVGWGFGRGRGREPAGRGGLDVVLGPDAAVAD
ncbi:hypothetical protein Asp14428_30940 [Actinoplanes sp. NBRC 14428]|nr:hypothetical protein Asp14428_30940 [Actinoplanes sp. NBRC 14428]